MKGLALVLVLLPLAASAATITVTSTADDTFAGDGQCTLREAVANVNAAADTTGGDCGAGTGGGDIIVFSLPLPATITLTTNSVLEIDTDVTINGPGADLLALDGNRATQVLNVTAGSVTVQNLTIRNGSSKWGGGIDNAATLSLIGCTLSANSAVSGGGVFNEYESTLTLSECTVRDNSALLESDCGFDCNAGGGIDNQGTLNVSASTISANSSADSGGLYNGGVATLSNCTLSDNAANDGGGIFNYGMLALTNCTLSNNQGGAIENDEYSGAVFLTNTIVAAGGRLGNCTGPITDGGYNIDDGLTCGFSGSGCADTRGTSFCGTDPGLDPGGLADNGGPTQTVAIEAGSPAFNAGDADACAAPPVDGRDQRGAARPGTGATACSIGAYEYSCTTNPCPTPPPAVPGVVGTGSAASCTEAALEDALAAGGHITFNCGARPFTIFVTATKLITQDTSLDGGGLLTLDGGGRAQVLSINTGMVDLSNLTVRNGRYEAGGGIYNYATLSLHNCTLAGNAGTDGAGIYNDGTLAMESCTVSGNVATGVGGGIANHGTLTLTDCMLAGNVAIDSRYYSPTGEGGAIYSDGEMTVTASTLRGNVAGADGGAVYNQGTAALSDCTFNGNSADSGNGGGTYNATGASAGLSNCTLVANTGQSGGGIYSDGILTLRTSTLNSNQAAGDSDPRGLGGGVYNDTHGTATLTDCALLGNTAAAGGGGVHNQGMMQLAGNTLSFNSAGYGRGGGGISNGGTATLTNCTLEFNSGTFSGGGAYNDGLIGLSHCTLSANWGYDYGGGVANDHGGTAILSDCTLSANLAGGGGGGGIANLGGTAVLTNSTVVGNGVPCFFDCGLGGGVLNTADGMLTLTDSTVSGNSASDGGAVANDGAAAQLTNCTLFGNSAAESGGGVYAAGTLMLTNCTVSSNTAPFNAGGNLYDNGSDGALTTLANTIVANSLGGGNCAGFSSPVVADGGHNLDSDGSCGVGPATDPRLDAAGLANNGGPTETIALQTDSPAINAGDSAICAAIPVNGLDQRGVTRPGAEASNCSIGAYEYEPTPPRTPAPTPMPTATPAHGSTVTVNTSADDTTPGDGHCTLREAIANVNAGADTTNGDCPAGSGAGDTIGFNLRLPATIVLTMDIPLAISSDVTIGAPDGRLLALEGMMDVRLIDVTAGTVGFENLTIHNTGYGGSVENHATLTLSHCVLSGSGDMYNDGVVTMSGCTLSGTGMENDVGGTATVSYCTLSGNGLFNRGTMVVHDSVLFGNHYCGVENDGALTLTNSTLQANENGLCNDANGTATVTDCSFLNNNGGVDGGGGVINLGSVALANCIVSGNTGDSGGAVYNDGTLAMTGCTLTGNTAYEGGGLFNDYSGVATLTNCVVSLNSADSDFGGGISTHGTMTLTDCTLFGNAVGISSYGYSGHGGGIASFDGKLTMSGCTLAANSARGQGGGIYNVDGTLELTNCTLFGNSSGSDDFYGGGGGIHHESGYSGSLTYGIDEYDAGALLLTNCTLSGNSSLSGANLSNKAWDRPSTALLANTIIAGGLGSGNCSGDWLVDRGHNIDSDGSCGIGPATDPGLDPAGLSDNGGPTQTIALLPDSPAINAGDEAICAAPDVSNRDQRGLARPGPGAANCSIGAYEYDSSVPTRTPTLTSTATFTVPTRTPTLTWTPSLTPTVTPTAPAPTPTVPSSPTCAMATEGSNLMLGCTDGIIIAIDFASYGTPQGSCGSFSQGRCHASTSLDVVAAACVGKAECELFVDDDTFGAEACAGTAATLAVQAECSLPAPTLTPTGTATPSFSDTPTVTNTPAPAGTYTPTATATPSLTPTPATTTAPTATSLPTGSPTPTSTPAGCSGDCDGNHHVDASELLRMVDIALGSQAAAGCAAGAAGNSITIEITAVVAAVQNALSGCPGTVTSDK